MTSIVTPLSRFTSFEPGERTFIEYRGRSIHRHWQCAVYQPGTSDDEDTQIDSLAPTTNYATATTATIGSLAGVFFYEYLTEIDLTTIIPAGSNIYFAMMRINVTSVNYTAPMLMSIYTLLRTSWSHSTATYSTEDGATVWTTAGARGDGTDYDSSYVDHVSLSDNTGHKMIDVTQTVKRGLSVSGGVGTWRTVWRGSNETGSQRCVMDTGDVTTKNKPTLLVVGEW